MLTYPPPPSIYIWLHNVQVVQPQAIIATHYSQTPPSPTSPLSPTLQLACICPLRTGTLQVPATTGSLKVHTLLAFMGLPSFWKNYIFLILWTCFAHILLIILQTITHTSLSLPSTMS